MASFCWARKTWQWILPLTQEPSYLLSSSPAKICAFVNPFQQGLPSAYFSPLKCMVHNSTGMASPFPVRHRRGGTLCAAPLCTYGSSGVIKLTYPARGHWISISHLTLQPWSLSRDILYSKCICHENVHLTKLEVTVQVQIPSFYARDWNLDT